MRYTSGCAPGVVVEQEGAAADPRGLRLDDVEYHLHCDRRIDGAAAGAKDRPAGFGGVRVGRRNHVPRADHGLARRRRRDAQRRRDGGDKGAQ